MCIDISTYIYSIIFTDALYVYIDIYIFTEYSMI
jgi:hypothetical protein